MYYKIVDGQAVVQRGKLTSTHFRGKDIEEAKIFFNMSEEKRHFEHPTAEFITDDNRVLTTIDLKINAKGYAATLYEYGKLYGCNMNRIKNRPGRWGVTIWIEPTDLKTAASI